MVIYLDVLLLSNLWADYALLHAAASLAHLPLPRLRGLLAAGIGAAFALTVLLPPLPAALCLIFRAVAAFAVCAAAFGFRHLLRTTALFLGLSLFFCGTVYALSRIRAPVGFYTRNTVIYADVSLMTLLLGTALAAGISAYFSRRNAVRQSRSLILHFRISGRDFALHALSDTGNTLRDPFTGKPVAVCAAAALESWLSRYPDTVTALSSCKGFRMLPVRTVTGARLLPAFQPEAATVSRSECPLAACRADLLIAVSDDAAPETPAIVPACAAP